MTQGDPLPEKPFFAQRFSQIRRRKMNRFVAQLKRAPVGDHQLSGPDLLKGLNRF